MIEFASCTAATCMNHDAQRVFRHRGKSPRQAAFFSGTPSSTFSPRNWQACTSCTDCCAVRVPASNRIIASDRWSRDPALPGIRGIPELHAPASISFEHAWFLLLALARHDEVGIARCGVCGGVRLRDLLAKHRVSCGACGPVAVAPC